MGPFPIKCHWSTNIPNDFHFLKESESDFLCAFHQLPEVPGNLRVGHGKGALLIARLSPRQLAPLLHLLLLLKDCGIRVVLTLLLLDPLQYLSFVAHFPRFFLHGMPRGMDQLLERLVSMGEVRSTVA